LRFASGAVERTDMRRWVTAARRTYGVAPAAVTEAYDDGQEQVSRPLSPGQSLPTATRSGPLGVLSMRVRRDVSEATYHVETATGTFDAVTAERPADVPESQSPTVVTVDERLAVTTRVVAVVALVALAAAAVGVVLVLAGAGGPPTSIGVLLLAGAVAAVADGYTRLRDRDDLVDSGVLYDRSEPFGHWMVAILVGVIVVALATGRARLVGVGWLVPLLVAPVAAPVRRLGVGASDWLHGWTAVSESRAVFRGPVGDPFSGGLQRRLTEAEEETTLRLLPTFVGQWSADGVDCQYRFSFESGDGPTRVVQRVALRRTAWAMQVLVLPLLFVGLLWAGWHALDAGVAEDPADTSLTDVLQIQEIVAGLAVTLAVFTAYVVVVGPTMVRLSQRPNPVGGIRDLSESYVHAETTFDALFAAPAGAFLLFGVFRGRPELLVLSAALVGCQLAVVTVGVVDGRPLLWVRRGYASVVGGTPVAARYARALAFVLLPLAAIGFAQFALGPTLGDAVSLPVVDLFLTGCVALFTVVVLSDLTTEVRGAGQHASRRKSVTPATVAVGVAAVAACSAATYLAVGYVAELWVLDGLFGVTASPYASFRLSVAAASLLVLSVPLGAFVQAGTAVAGRLAEPPDARTLTTAAAEVTSAPVYVVLDERPFSEAVSTIRGADYVRISTGMCDVLDDEQRVAAVLAHEQAHIDHGDTRLGLYLPVLGALTLTGQNVLFDLFDVPEREHRADIAAATDVGPRTLIEALDRLDEYDPETETHVGTGTLGVPPADTAAVDSPLSLLVRPFRLFFGAFALTDIHPTTDARRRRLRTRFDG
jgi:Zn-dependent protease with chaperone function